MSEVNFSNDDELSEIDRQIRLGNYEPTNDVIQKLISDLIYLQLKWNWHENMPVCADVIRLNLENAKLKLKLATGIDLE